MKSSKADPRKKASNGSGTGKLLHDIETISSALFQDKTRSRNSVPNLNNRSQSVRKSYPDEKTNDRSLQKGKKSTWSWKSLMNFTRNRKFNCCFSLQVHSIEGLPSCFEDLDLCVYFRRQNESMVTPPARVLEGVAIFEGYLTLTCSVYGSRSGPHHSAKYEVKHFLLYAAIQDAPELNLGKHRIDLTRFLPLTLEELEDEKSSSKWSTSFKLSGMAEGASMNVTFGYSILGSSSNTTTPGLKRDVSHLSSFKRNNEIMDQSEIKGMIQRSGSLPARSSMSSRSVEDIKDLHEVLPTSSSTELAKSVGILYRKLDEEKLDLKVDSKSEVDVTSAAFEPKSNFDSVSGDGNDIDSRKSEHEKIEPFPLEQKVEPKVEEVKLGSLNSEMEKSTFSKTDSAVEDLNLNQNVIDEGCTAGDELAVMKEDDQCTTESLMKDLEMALHNVSVEEIELTSPEKPEDDKFTKIKSDYKMKRKAKSLCLDDVTNSVADEFLNVLGIEHSPFGLSSESEPESPRERLLKQFEKDTLASGCSLFDFNMEEVSHEELEWGPEYDLFQTELNLATGKPRATMLEDIETEALMREWGLNEKAFAESPPGRSVGFLDISPEEVPPQLPPLGEGVGPFIQTKNGGFLRTMSPTHFVNAKSGGSLVMQVSSPVVVPAEMGSGIMDILERLASVGIEKLSMQANKLMPLDDVTGKTMQQVAWEGVPGLEASERLNIDHGVEHSLASAQKREESSQFKKEINSEYVSLEGLAPLAMDKIEALSIEGLRIQSGMSDEEAPSNITPQTFGEISALEGKRMNLGGTLGLEGTGGLQLLDIKESGDVDDADNLMSLSLTLDEWLRIDSGEIDDEDGISERTCKILAAHHASDSIRERSKSDKKKGKSGSRKYGLLGNNFTVALLVQLRDPVRNYEPVGTPMLALIQVERVFVPPKPKFYSTVSDLRSKKTGNEEEDVETKPGRKEVVIIEEPKEEERVTQFKITEVHVAGLKTEPGKKKIWGSTGQQQAGSRWLVANGMGKGKKAPFGKPKGVGKSVVPATVTAQRGDTLWSISARALENGSRWKELAKLNPHIRNPDVILPDEIIKLR